VGGEETVAQMHLLGSRDPALGRVDTEMRREMEEFAEKIGLDFIVNVVLNCSGLVVDAMAGYFVQAHRVGVEKARQVFGITIPGLADIAISSTSPVDFDFFQADKGLFAAEPAVRTGGEIILVSGCVEGISPAHPELAQLLNPGRKQKESLREWPVDPMGLATISDQAAHPVLRGETTGSGRCCGRAGCRTPSRRRRRSRSMI
jgi:nickel-dependent lactate racemase